MDIFGGLIEFEDNKEFDDFLNGMDKDSAVKIMETAIDYGQKLGVYTMLESVCLYKTLNKLKEDANKNQGDSIHNDDTNGDIS